MAGLTCSGNGCGLMELRSVLQHDWLAGAGGYDGYRKRPGWHGKFDSDREVWFSGRPPHLGLSEVFPQGSVNHIYVELVSEIAKTCGWDVLETYLVSFVATNTTGFGASPWLTFCLLMTDWLAALIPNANGLPLVDKELAPVCSQWEHLDRSTLFSNCGKVDVSLYGILTLSKGLLPSRADALRGWLTWLRLIGVGAPRGALSFKGAWIAEE